MLNVLLSKRRQQEPIVTTAHAQNFKIFNMSVPELLSNISLLEETSKTYLDWFSGAIDRLETMRNSTCIQLQKI